ncbi:MAG: hypothetical protein RLZ36_1115 [Pseudomonadota bacterium]|jgi:CheY-like chemotaxis protein
MRNLMVLVVDDNLVSRLLPGFMLKSLHPQVSVIDCENGDDALSLIRSHPITHVLLDISMPNLNGIQTAYRIKEIEKSINIELIAYTADASMDDDHYLKSLGFNCALLKPIDRLSLFRVLGL